MISADKIEQLLSEVNKLHARYELSGTLPSDYFEPGMMEYLDKSEGLYHHDSGELLLRFEVKGTRYDGRTELIETVNVGDPVITARDETNQFNPNNFTFFTADNRNLGNMPADLCNAIAPLYDDNSLEIKDTKVSFVDPVSKRSRHAKQAILFVEMKCQLKL
jgi:hypothetical protein